MFAQNYSRGDMIFYQAHKFGGKRRRLDYGRGSQGGRFHFTVGTSF
ncbi:MAG: hypothetical protein IJL12_00930 [Selenomonadaceae bacterium]|nr:hypothetical protein [Selenomonadaceae bacterium]MBQ7493705.1 hypothetical protein [Selenomonadaceae bacterium]